MAILHPSGRFGPIARRIAAAILCVVSVVVLVACCIATVYLWKVREPLRTGTNNTFEKAGQALGITDRGLEFATERLRQAKADLATIKESNPPHDTSPPPEPDMVNRMMSRVIINRLGNNVHAVSDTVAMVTDGSIVLNSLMEGLNRLPEASLVGLNPDQLKQTQDSLAEILKSSQELNSLLELSVPDEAGKYHINSKTAGIEELLDRLLLRLEDFRSKVTALQQGVSQLQRRTDRWFEDGPFVITVILGWLAASQISMFLVGRRWYYRVANNCSSSAQGEAVP